MALTGAALLAALPTSSAPTVYAATGPKAYVGLFKEDAVAVLDTASNTVLSKIAVPTGPHGMVATPDGKKVYVSSDGATTVSVIDTSTDAVTRTIEVGKTPHGLAMTPDGKMALVGVWGDGQVAFLDTGTDQVVRRSAVGSPHNLDVTPDGAFAYVGSQAQDAPALVKLNVSTGAEVSRLPLDGAPRGVTVRPDGKAVYVTRAGQDDLLAVDTTADQPAARLAVGASPHLPSFTSTGLGLVNVQGPGLLAAFDPSTSTALGTVAVGKMPHWTALSADGQTALETNEGSNDVSVVDLPSLSVRATIPVGEAPRKIVIVPGTAGSAAGAAQEGAPAEVPMAAPVAPSQAQANAPAVGDVEVKIDRFSFGSPVTIIAGQTVSWLNGDAVTHTVTADDDSWDSDNLAPGQRFTKTFDTPGTYAYYCEIHPHMRGQIVVR
jgi:YVTN family beta-propeller protein